MLCGGGGMSERILLILLIAGGFVALFWGIVLFWMESTLRREMFKGPPPIPEPPLIPVWKEHAV